MADAIAGIHHVTAICGPPQENLDFMIETLRQNFVKRTVNFDAPDTYHFYYGDDEGSPGTIMTFFPFANAGSGRSGPGMASAVAYAVPAGELDAWLGLFADQAVNFEGPLSRFDERMIATRTPDGLRIELIETPQARASSGAPPVDDGFHSVTLHVAESGPTAELLVEIFGYEAAAAADEEGGRRERFQSPSRGRGSVVDLVSASTGSSASSGRPGAGTVHHVAFRAEDEEEHLVLRQRVLDAGLDVTPVIDRQYFKSIYFREPGGVLFEIATDGPGFAIDEPVESLGQRLKLPPQHEPNRERIERTLAPIRVPVRVTE